MEYLPENLPVYLIGADYSGKHNKLFLIFYDPKSQKLYCQQGSDHEPYCLTNLSPMELNMIEPLKKHPSFERFEMVSKYDALHDKDITVTKIIVKDPRAIGGGRPKENIRDIIPDNWEGAKVWEARIVYDNCYIYDKELEMGMPYKLYNGELIEGDLPFEVRGKINEVSEKIGLGKVRDSLEAEEKENKQYRWLSYFEFPIPEFRRVALDIEVLGEAETRVPDANKAIYPVISACLIGSDGKRRVLVLLRKGVEIGEEIVNASMEFYDKEEDLLREIFKAIEEYPFVITFNGDNFDLSYLYNRAIKTFKFDKEDIPILPRRRILKIRNSIHIDLYRFFFNRSLKNYAFKAKYKSISLNEIGRALIGKGKIHTDEDVWLATEMKKWSYTQLAKYNVQDGDITLELTTYNDSLVMRLMVILSRLSAIPIEDLIRLPISAWIRGMFYYEHRRRDYLIPNSYDIKELKGETVTKAVIKGKKYKGAIVIKPVAGVHFNVAVMDFASLYPSILKIKNLGYATVCCPHKDCQTNKIPKTSHWVCTQNMAMEAEIIGLLRDLRVFHYKTLGKTDPFYSVVEQAIKVFLNASYGVFGDDSFSLYCPPVAESITATGRHSIEETIKHAQSIGVEILYGDTDSVFMKNPTKEQVQQMVDWSIETLGLDLDVDKEYRYVCLSSRKKNYLGVTPNGNVDVKGMSGKKKHIPIIIKTAFNVTKKYLAEAKTKKEVEVIKKTLKKIIRDVYFRIKRRNFDLEEMAFRFTLGKSPNLYEKTTPQHVRAARMLEKEGIYLKKGDAISFIKCIPFKWSPDRDTKPVKVSVKPLQLAKKEDVNVIKYHEILQSTFEQLLDALEIDYNSVIGLIKLEQFM